MCGVVSCVVLCVCCGVLCAESVWVMGVLCFDVVVCWAVSSCVVLTCVLGCVCGVWCVVVCVACVARLGTRKKTVCRLKTSPCVGSKRFRVCRQTRACLTHARVLPAHTEVYWTNTRRRFEPTHGEEGGEGVSYLSLVPSLFLFLRSSSLSLLFLSPLLSQ